jgi:hypothetical protein
MDSCEHLKKVKEGVIPRTPKGCEECLTTGDTWVHLRLCLMCRYVGCCDNSKNKHATKHPVIKSFEPDENWKYCYIDDLTIE